MNSSALFVLTAITLAACADARRGAVSPSVKFPGADVLPPYVEKRLVAITEDDFAPYDVTKVARGRALFFDKRLSRRGDVACATCHDPAHAMTDGLSLPIGTGGLAGARTRIARNAPTVVNRGMKHFRELFWDGRAKGLAEQAMHPLLDADEMDAPLLADAKETAESLAAYESSLRFYRSPFQRHLEGDATALTVAERRGMDLFAGKAQCLNCHHGPALSDGLYHATGVPQIGPGRGGVGFAAHDDYGRELVTGQRFDRYRFRTPSLLNVAETGPWGHDGAFGSLREVVRHYASPVTYLAAYDRAQARLPFRVDFAVIDFLVLDDGASRAAIVSETGIAPVALDDSEIDDIVAFLGALTDPAIKRIARSPRPL